MYFKSLQILRAIAALSVIFYHIHIYSVLIGNNYENWFKIFKENFAYGALFFFVLSGFLMAYLIDIDYKDFLRLRILRIYPTYIIAVILVIFFKVMIFGSIENEKLYLAITLLPFGELQYPLGIEWTLIYEVFFYLICSLFTTRILKRLYLFFLITWFNIIIVGDFIFHTQTLFKPYISNILFSSFNLLFICGSIAYLIAKKIEKPNKSYDYLGIMIAFSLVFLSNISTATLVKNLMLGTGFSMIIMIAYLRDKYPNKNKKILFIETITSFAETFGDYSYGIYLVHVPIITVIFSVSKNMFNFPINSEICLISLVISLFVGWHYGRMELNIYKKLKMLVKYK
ncbi:acyltransferase family protein [Nostoc sp.]|uniref:acyltransferase family protein n=1 Tax=Nostoc sp. TaxID=1180 RepID=UPI002FF72A0E